MQPGALGVRTPPAECSVLAVLLEHALLSNVIVRTDAGLDPVPSNFGLAGLAFMADLAKEMRLRAALSQVNAVQQKSRAISPGSKSPLCGITLLPVARLARKMH